MGGWRRSRFLDRKKLIVTRISSISAKKLDLCSVEVRASFGVAQRAS